MPYNDDPLVGCGADLAVIAVLLGIAVLLVLAVLIL